MSDYDILVALVSEYWEELDCRKAFCETHSSAYDCRNKERLRRLRLEIGRKMLQIEDRMTGYRESWFKGEE